MSIRKSYNHTFLASCIGYVVQSLVLNFVPLLFAFFNTSYGIEYSDISFLIIVMFIMQLLADLASPVLVKLIGYRGSAVLAHVLASFGLVMLAILPGSFENKYPGIVFPLLFTSVGGGIIEAVISPIVEACPNSNKSGHMCLLHSFFCWGHVFIVLVSVFYFGFCGIENWGYLSIAFALIPFINIFYFMLVPINSLEDEARKISGKENLTLSKLFKNKIFWLMFLLMFCAGASELSISQWASALAEQGLGVSKTVGDLAGPMTFAILMGLSRVFYSLLGKKLKLPGYMLFSALLSFGGYMMVSLSPWPFLSLIGCAVCGWAVGVMWPGTYSLATERLCGGSTAMFAFLALAGDLGCTAGPTIVGFVSEKFGNDLKIGLFSASVFSLVMIIGVLLLLFYKNKRLKEKAEN